MSVARCPQSIEISTFPYKGSRKHFRDMYAGLIRAQAAQRYEIIKRRQMLDSISADASAEILIDNNTIDYIPEIRQSQLPNLKGFPVEGFFKIGFSHHTAILSHFKTIEERLFYIKFCADEQLCYDVLLKFMKQDVFHNQGTMPNNFMAKIDDAEPARRTNLQFST